MIVSSSSFSCPQMGQVGLLAPAPGSTPVPVEGIGNGNQLVQIQQARELFHVALLKRFHSRRMHMQIPREMAGTDWQINIASQQLQQLQIHQYNQGILHTLIISRHMTLDKLY